METIIDSINECLENGDFPEAYNLICTYSHMLDSSFTEIKNDCLDMIAEQQKYIINRFLSVGNYADANFQKKYFYDTYGRHPVIDSIKIYEY